ncbi:hypothetical protein HN419_06050 [Candidatus Woesearchaeota archaeon]|jgi:hypothetical protein|nr:hypothetical protein [Candidatus Woesearchaeota archaeon]MBT3537567.1 hypothetical protein [Candidatus Woesearchaeota archaeon]MBT4698373.1 hypothetical protein [Candidatus Woesearchaeota archaeon]MBT7105236.1 hypothetical protein [Candidatus Woesearchaeota archaeon]MBT7930499.1 hypothetical protein [Candidatus Woesearchaeota archaeon]
MVKRGMILLLLTVAFVFTLSFASLVNAVFLDKHGGNKPSGWGVMGHPSYNRMYEGGNILGYNFIGDMPWTDEPDEYAYDVIMAFTTPDWLGLAICAASTTMDFGTAVAGGGIMGRNRGSFYVSANAEIGKPFWNFDKCGNPFNSTYMEDEGLTNCNVMEMESMTDPTSANFRNCSPCMSVPLYAEWKIGIPATSKGLTGDLEDHLYYSVYFINDDEIGIEPGEGDYGMGEELVLSEYGEYEEGGWGSGWGEPSEDIRSSEIEIEKLIFAENPEGVKYACSYLTGDDRGSGDYDDILDICKVSAGGNSHKFATAYIPATSFLTEAVDFIVVEGKMWDEDDLTEEFAYPFPVISYRHVPSEQVLQEMCEGSDDFPCSELDFDYDSSSTSSSSSSSGGAALGNSGSFGASHSE